MANNDVKTRIVLEGEQQYRQALKDAQRNLKTLRSELKAETAELGKNATEQQKNAVKAENLKQQIKEQEEVVKTYKAALEEVRTKYADNEDAIAKWEQKLNEARAALANMKNELDGTSDGMEGVKETTEESVVAAKSLADAFKDLSSVGDSVSSALEGIFSGVLDTLTDAISNLWGLITDTAAKANNWTDLASYFGSTTTEMQKLHYGMKSAQGDFQDFINLTNQLTFGGKSKSIAEVLGLSDVNYEDSVAFTELVLDTLSQMNRTDANDAMEKIFGGKSKNFSWLVSNWGKVKEEMQEFSDEGYLLDEETVETFNQVYLQLGDIDAKWDALKTKFASGFGTVTLSILTNVSGALDALSEYFNASDEGERAKALEKLRTNIEEAFATLKEAIETGLANLKALGEGLQGSSDPAVKAVGELLSSLSESLQWCIDNADKVKWAFKTIFGIWLVARLSKIATQLTGIMANIATIQKFSLAGGLANGVNATTTATSTATATAGGSILGSLLKGGLPNLLMGWGIWEGVKKIPTGGLSGMTEWLQSLFPGGDTAAKVDKIQKEAGLETVGDVVTSVANTSQDRNKKALGFMFGFGTGAPEPPTPLSETQVTALENFWDMLRSGEYNRDTYVELQNAFGDNLKLMNSLVEEMEKLPETEYGSEDIPSDWWQQQTNVTRDLPEKVEGATERGVIRGMSGLRFELDGDSIARLITPYIDQRLAASLNL